jgi:hypothetical protein
MRLSKPTVGKVRSCPTLREYPKLAKDSMVGMKLFTWSIATIQEERKRKGGQLQRSVLTTLLMYELYWDM